MALRAGPTEPGRFSKDSELFSGQSEGTGEVRAGNDERREEQKIPYHSAWEYAEAMRGLVRWQQS